MLVLGIDLVAHILADISEPSKTDRFKRDYNWDRDIQETFFVTIAIDLLS
jgi:hypothetical protein